MRFPIILLCSLPLLGQPPELDLWPEPLPLPTAAPTATPELVTEEARDLSLFMEQLPLEAQALELPEEAPPVMELVLESQDAVVIPNPAHLPRALEVLQALRGSDQIPERSSMLLRLHADNNFSIALPLQGSKEAHLPAGSDFSPLPATRLLGVPIQLTRLDRKNPEFLSGYLRLRQKLQRSGEKALSRDLILLPMTEDRWLLAVEVPQKKP